MDTKEKELERKYKIDKIKSFFVTAFPNIFGIIALICFIVICIVTDGMENTDIVYSNGLFVVEIMCMIIWFFYNFFAAWIYMKLKGITSSAYTYNTGRTITKVEYNSSSDSFTSRSYAETETEGGGEYFGCLCLIAFFGVFFYIYLLIELRDDYKYELLKLNKLYEFKVYLDTNKISEKELEEYIEFHNQVPWDEYYRYDYIKTESAKTNNKVVKYVANNLLKELKNRDILDFVKTYLEKVKKQNKFSEFQAFMQSNEVSISDCEGFIKFYNNVPWGTPYFEQVFSKEKSKVDNIILDFINDNEKMLNIKDKTIRERILEIVKQSLNEKKNA